MKPISLCITAILLSTSTNVGAHEFDPHVVTLTQGDDGRFLMTAAWAKGRPRATLTTPSDCFWQSPYLSCRNESASLRFEGMAPEDAGLILRIVRNDQAREIFLSARQPAFRLAPDTANNRSWLSYIGLGIHHIWIGADHLLFLLLLTLIIHNRRTLVAAISAFTVGHSLTLIATIMFGSLAAAPVEASIALSVVLLARRALIGTPTPHAVYMAGLFGLVHGLGFAGVLMSIGLPTQQRLFALLSFNVGVEIGQLVFVTMIGAISAAMRAVPGPYGEKVSFIAHRTIIYASGSVATFWLFARVAALGIGG
ncbi:MAG: HupE/UreJ family protein [Myxococcota bacterium]